MGEEARTPPNFWERGHRWPGLSDISEWIKIEGQGIRGLMTLLTFLEGYRFVCAPDFREIQVQIKNIMHCNYIEV